MIFEDIGTTNSLILVFLILCSSVFCIAFAYFRYTQQQTKKTSDKKGAEY